MDKTDYNSALVKKLRAVFT